MPLQRAQIDIDRKKFAFIDLMPLTESMNVSTTDLIVEAEDDIAGVGLILAIYQSSKAIPVLNMDRWITSSDQPAPDISGYRQ